MLAWVAANGGVRAIGDAGAVTVRTTDWCESSESPALSRPVEETVTGSVTGIEIPGTAARLTDTESRQYDLSGGAVVSEGAYLLSCRLAPGTETAAADAGMEASIRFDGPAKVGRTHEGFRVEFPARTPITMGFTERGDDPATITVPETPAGVATALTHLAAAHRTMGPERSHPSLRDHPPVVELGPEASIPDAVVEATPDTGIELQLPASLEYLFVAAPLAYYLGAAVTVEERATPRLLAPAAGVHYRFRNLPTFQHGVARLLRQVFFFDTVVRHVDGEDARGLASEFGLDRASVRSLSPARRLARYFDIPDGDLDAALPEWHFSTYVAPETRNVSALPYLLDALSLVYLPESSELRGTELLERTLDDFYRSEGEVASSDSMTVVSPELQAGQVHAWLAPGAPIDAFKTTTQAYLNRRRYRDRGTPLSVAVVLNDDAMAAEHTAAEDIYRDRAADLPLSVTVHEHLTRDELADTFAAPNDLVHYIGHCDETGLKCADGHLATESLDEVNTRTFFLNACGSYHEGLSLVDAGSVGGAVTLTKVLDRQAATVGTAFARLLVNGFGLEPAMQLSRRRIMMGKDYVVVGDGTYTLAPTEGTPVVCWLTECDEGFELTCESLTGRRNGTTYQPPFGGEQVLHGHSARTTLDRDHLRHVLADASLPVIYDNEFHWSDDIADRLADE